LRVPYRVVSSAVLIVLLAAGLYAQEVDLSRQAISGAGRQARGDRTTAPFEVEHIVPEA